MVERQVGRRPNLRTPIALKISLPPVAALGAELGMSEGAARVAVCRLRERYRECLKEEIGHTVATASEVEAELHHLFRVLARG